MCRFVHRNHTLPIVVGRWTSKPYHERLCEHCRVLGDEYHFIFCCTSGNLPALRNKYIDRYYRISPSMFKFVQLFRCTNKRVMQNLAIFIYKGLYEKS